MFYRKTATVIILILILSVFALPVCALGAEKDKSGENTSSLETTAKSAILMDAVSGKILYSKEEHKELPMASVTKLMSMLLMVEAVESGKLDLKEKVVASENAAGMGGSQIFLERGEEMTVEDMLISIATGSANDATVAMAEKIYGSEEEFVKQMNEKAKALGLKNTHFSNTTGLPVENHYTSAYDMAIILKENLKYPLFKRISGIYEYDIRGGEFKLWNTNKLLKWYSGADAGKTGWTSEADYCLASSAVRDGMRLICAVLGTSEPRSHFRETIKIFDYGFARYKMITLVDSGTRVETVKVNRGTVESLGLVTEKQAGCVVEKVENKGFYGEVRAPKEVNAPVKKGEVLGKYVVLRDGKEIMSVSLTAENTIPRASLFRQMYKVMEKMYC